MYKLILEFKTTDELAQTVALLGGKAESGTVKTSTTTRGGKTSTTTRGGKTSTTTRGGKKEPTSSNKKEQEVQLPPSPAPAFDPGANAAAAMQAPPAPSIPVAPTAPAGFNRAGALAEIQESLGKLANAGVPEAQLLPLVQQQYAAVGAPTDKRLSELDDATLAKLAPLVKQVVDGQLSQASAPGFM